ncbi:hypothetical protein V9T40_009039 [Parthenolecanium corni]|uniref:CLIP domain-containing serine protease n=1 Tax=Parthenolecanium corni TaxID=536013 RepID=A0AAN9U0K6_9HEMI
MTSDNTPGSCVKLKRCKKLNDLLANKLERNPQTEELFRKYKCGWRNNDPMFCCEDVRDQVPPKTKPADCGITSIIHERLFGGRKADLGGWPWMVALGFCKWYDPTISYRCGASLIADEWLLTTAHCVVNTSPFQLTTARLGDLDLDDSVVDNASPVDVPIESSSVFPHPKYLDDHLTTPICLLSGTTYEKDEYYKNKRPYVIGWGRTEYGKL